MRRRYTTDEFRSAVAQIREVNPHASVTTDIIVGFPGENDNEFDDSFRFCRDIGFAAIHVFMFSARPGTPAAAMPNQIDAPVKKMRSLRMLALAQKSAVEYRKQFIGQIHNVLWESETNPGTGIFDGLTDTYIRVFARSDQPLNNRLLPAKLTAIVRGGIKGELTA
jgi:threonylcarbamoyladenosine tRNA methylthiotransferase MtaB